MRLDISRITDRGCTPEYFQQAVNLLGQLMEMFGISCIKGVLANGISTKIGIVTDIGMFDFAPARIVELGTCMAADLGKSMLSLGASKLEILDVNDDEKAALTKLWNDSGLGISLPSSGMRLSPPPELVPDMKPIEVNL